jgi:hypothetical protein
MQHMASVRQAVSSELLEKKNPEEMLNIISDWVQECRTVLSGFQAYDVQELRMTVTSSTTRFTGEISGFRDMTL